MTPQELAALEQEWIGRIPTDPGYFGWEPADPDEFTQLLAAADGGRFIDAGCGIGTKCVLAAQAGFEAEGIDRVPQFITQATSLGVRALLADIRDWDFSPYDVVYVNHPLACSGGCTDEAVLEHHIHESMSPGAVLLAMNYDLAPGCTAHSPLVPCDEPCALPAVDGWREIARLRPWAAAWVKLWPSR